MATVQTGSCMLCGKPSQVEVPDELAKKAEAFVKNKHDFGFVQNEFPDLPASVRETLMNGTHSDCFDKAFPDE